MYRKLNILEILDGLCNVSNLLLFYWKALLIVSFSGSGRTETRESLRQTFQASSHFGAGGLSSKERLKMMTRINKTAKTDLAPWCYKRMGFGWMVSFSILVSRGPLFSCKRFFI